MIHLMQIKRDDLRGPEIAAMLEVHLKGFGLRSPRESCHTLDLNVLRRPEGQCYTA